MKIKETLRSLDAYYAATRAVGHTHTMIEGAKNAPKVAVLVGSFTQGRDLALLDLFHKYRECVISTALGHERSGEILCSPDKKISRLRSK